jgi:hypothetical protein
VFEAGVARRNADDLGDAAADLGRRVELALALATFGGEVAHQVFIGVAQDVVVLGAVVREVEPGFLLAFFERDPRVLGAAVRYSTLAERAQFVEISFVPTSQESSCLPCTHCTTFPLAY